MPVQLKCYIVLKIQRNRDGRIVVHKDPQVFNSPNLAYDYACYQWGEGNYSCDCNRAIFFNLGLRKDELTPEDDDAECRCGDTDYTVLEVRLEPVESWTSVEKWDAVLFRYDPRDRLK